MALDGFGDPCTSPLDLRSKNSVSIKVGLLILQFPPLRDNKQIFYFNTNRLVCFFYEQDHLHKKLMTVPFFPTR